MEKIVNVQLLRAFAALMVVLYHAASLFHSIGGDQSENIYTFFSRFGYAGVDVFFVISGYIIWISTQKVNTTKQITGYLYNRATRIYLGYWPYLIMFLIIGYLFAIPLSSHTDLIGSIFLTQPYMHKLVIDVTWTLRYELYFYLCFAFLLLFPRKQLNWILILLFVLLTAIQLFYVFITEAYLPENYYQQNMFFWFYSSPFCLEFLAGAMVAWFFENGRINNLLLVCLSSLALFGLAIYYQSTLVNGALSQGYYAPIRVLFFGLGAACLLGCLVELEKRGHQIFSPFSLLLGGASYSLYLGHAVIFYFTIRTEIGVKMVSLGLNPFFVTSIFVMVIIVYSVIHYQFIEQPLMRLSRKLKPKSLLTAQKPKKQ